MLNRILVIIFFTVIVNACGYVPKLDEVLPDRRKDYQKSESLPELEVPPDLTVEALENPLEIPAEEVTTLSEYEARKGNKSTRTLDASGVDPRAGEEWILVQGRTAEIWPKLTQFWTSRGYTLDVDDSELGVLETGWLETNNQGISVFRDKFTLVTESGNTAGTTVIYISSERNERIVGVENNSWIKIETDPEFKKNLISDMNIYFYGENAPTGNTSITSSRPAPDTTTVAIQRARAEMLDLGEDKVYLSLPDEFVRAWELTEEAILRAGMFIEGNDQSKGVYNVIFYDAAEDEEGLLSKLKFWGDEEDEGGLAYQVSLTGVGDKTELVVLDNKGHWIPKEDAARILTFIQSQYNSITR